MAFRTAMLAPDLYSCPGAPWIVPALDAPTPLFQPLCNEGESPERPYRTWIPTSFQGTRKPGSPYWTKVWYKGDIELHPIPRPPFSLPCPHPRPTTRL